MRISPLIHHFCPEFSTDVIPSRHGGNIAFLFLLVVLVVCQPILQLVISYQPGKPAKSGEALIHSTKHQSPLLSNNQEFVPVIIGDVATVTVGDNAANHWLSDDNHP